MIRLLKNGLPFLITLLYSCQSFFGPDLDSLNHNAPSLYEHVNAPLKGTYIGFIRTPDKKTKYPIIMEVLEHRTPNRRSLKFMIHGKISLGWNSPIYQTVVSEDVGFSRKKQKFKLSKSNDDFKLAFARYHKPGRISGKFTDSHDQAEYAFEVKWHKRTDTGSGSNSLDLTIFPKSRMANLSTELYANKCHIGQPFSSVKISPQAKPRHRGLFAGYIVTVELNNTSGKRSNKIISGSINAAQHRIELLNSDKNKRCAIKTAGLQCQRCLYKPLAKNNKLTLPTGTTAIPKINEESNPLSHATSGSYFGYLHLENRNLLQTLRIAIDRPSSKAIITTFLGEIEANEFITHHTFSRTTAFTRGSILKGDSDAFIQITRANSRRINGIIYSYSSGRLGRFVVDRKGVQPTATSKILPSLSGDFRSADGQLSLIALPSNSTEHNLFSTLNISALLKSEPDTKQQKINITRLDINHGTLHLYPQGASPIQITLGDQSIHLRDLNYSKVNPREKNVFSKNLSYGAESN